jgi:hypothetical protein
MRRRDFLASLGGYSLIVLADDARAEGDAGRPERTVEEIRAAIDAVSPDRAATAPPGPERFLAEVTLPCDVLVAGGGPAGVCAAVAAARNGARVVLVQDRSRLGGNSSSEVKMHIVGANCHNGRPGWREGGLIEEFRLDDAANNPQRCWEMWDLLLYSKCVSEPNLTLLLDTTLYGVEMKDGRIDRAFARCDKTEHRYTIPAKVFIDATGDCRLGLEAGAEMRHGREARAEFNESLARETPDRETLGSSILFTSRKHDRPMPFTPPPWARKVTKKQLLKRPVNNWEYGYWWIEWGGQIDTIRDNERIRFELLSIVMGVWDYIKNSGAHPSSANWALDWVGMVPGKRESRRLVGDHMLTQHDLMGLAAPLDDAVAIGGWPMDDHPPSGFDRDDEPACVQIRTPVYSIPLRSLYSVNVPNLMMAGRNISASHVAFTSTRVMATCAVMGQAAGTAAAACAEQGVDPRALYQDKSRLRRLQQTLLRDDQSILGVLPEDPSDHARSAVIAASDSTSDAPVENLVDGHVRDIPNGAIHRWSAEMTPDGAWVELTWKKPVTLREVQVTFDTGFQRQLTLTSSDGSNKGIVRAPQPETVRDYTLSVIPAAGDATPVAVADVKGNHQRLRRHGFGPVAVKSLRLHVHATNGDPLARVFEVRCHG